MLGSSNGLGLNVQVSYTDGNMSLSYGFSMNGFAKYQDTGKSGVQFRNSFMATYDDGKTGFSLGTNIWGGAGGMEEFNQRTGVIGIHSGDFRFNYENDGAPFNKIKTGDGNDSYRTAAASIGIGKYSVGFNLFTGKRQDYSGDKVEVDRALALGKGNSLGDFNERMPNGFVKEEGPQYRFGGLYISDGSSRIGIDSDRWVRHPIQDHFAHNWIGETQPGFRSLSNSIVPYFQYQTSNSFTSW